MDILKKTITERFNMVEAYEEMERLSVILEASKYDGTDPSYFIMVNYFNEHMNINESQFSRSFNKLFSELLGHFNNTASIIERLPAQFIFNSDFKTKFIELLPIPEDDIVNIIQEWNRGNVKKFGGKETSIRTVKEMFAISFPYMYLALTVKNKELSLNILVMLNTLMYAMAYANSFPNYNYIKDKGEYVIQHLLKKRGFGKYASILELMTKVSEDTRRTFMSKTLSDRVIYEAVWSNVQGKMKYYMKQFHNLYQSIGEKYLTTSKDIMSTSDRDGKDSTVESNIDNDSALVLKLSKDVTNYISDPAYIENSAIKVALKKIMGIDLNRRKNGIDKKSLVERNVYYMIEEIQKTRDFETIVANILQNFLWVDGNTVVHIQTPKFLDKITYDLTYVGKNKIYINNINKLVDIYINKALEHKGKSTKTIDNKTLQKYRKTITYYFALLTQQIYKQN